MKRTLLITLSFLFSLSALSMELATYRFATSEVIGGEHTVKVMVATLNDDQSLTVELSKASGDHPWMMSSVGETTTHTKYLNNVTFETLRTQIVGISNAPIKRVTTAVVCMMMPGPAQSNDHLSVRRGYDWNAQDFFGELELVLGPQGCWVANKVFPENERATQQARALKNSLRLLSIDFAGNF